MHNRNAKPLLVVTGQGLRCDGGQVPLNVNHDSETALVIFIYRGVSEYGSFCFPKPFTVIFAVIMLKSLSTKSWNPSVLPSSGWPHRD